MPSLSDITSRLLLMNDKDLSDEISSFHEAWVIIHEYSIEIKRLELMGVSKQEIIEELQDAREIHERSVFISRLQNWPRGYQGDFETIEYLCDGINQSPPNTVEYYLENAVLFSSMAQQHKNKVLWQSKLILDSIHENRIDEKRNILSIGSGACRDLRLIKPALNNSDVRIIINDIDEGAISLSKQKLGSVWCNITPILGDSYRKAKEMSKNGPYQLIVAGGLFDYLPNKYACALLEKLSMMLTRGGKICLTNILRPNPWRLWMTYLANWNLIERTELDFRNMFDAFGLGRLKISMEPDGTSLAGLYEITVD